MFSRLTPKFEANWLMLKGCRNSYKLPFTYVLFSGETIQTCRPSANNNISSDFNLKRNLENIVYVTKTQWVIYWGETYFGDRLGTPPPPPQKKK